MERKSLPSKEQQAEKVDTNNSRKLDIQTALKIDNEISRSKEFHKQFCKRHNRFRSSKWESRPRIQINEKWKEHEGVDEICKGPKDSQDEMNKIDSFIAFEITVNIIICVAIESGNKDFKKGDSKHGIHKDGKERDCFDRIRENRGVFSIWIAD